MSPAQYRFLSFRDNGLKHAGYFCGVALVGNGWPPVEFLESTRRAPFCAKLAALTWVNCSVSIRLMAKAHKTPHSSKSSSRSESKPMKKKELATTPTGATGWCRAGRPARAGAAEG